MASVWPTAPTIPPCWEITNRIIIAQYHTNQFTFSRGPGTLFSAYKGVWLHVMVYRPNSICVETLITQPMIMSHSSQNPASAPALVVAINSPDPTIEPAIIIPGPSRRSVAPSVRGGSLTSKVSAGVDSLLLRTLSVFDLLSVDIGFLTFPSRYLRTMGRFY